MAKTESGSARLSALISISRRHATYRPIIQIPHVFAASFRRSLFLPSANIIARINLRPGVDDRRMSTLLSAADFLGSSPRNADPPRLLHPVIRIRFTRWPRTLALRYLVFT